MGRARERGVIADVLAEDGPRALLLEGEPGIGKTTLWQVGVESARELSHRVLVARPAETEADLPFCALADLLDGVLEEALPSLPDAQRLALEVALQRRAPSDEPTDRFAVSLAVVAILRTAPTIVAVDDVQWLDAPTAQVLEFALRRVGAAPVRLLLARRDGDRAPLPLGLEDGFPVERVRVGPLTVDELDRLIVARLDRQLPRPLLVRLHGVSGGNPYFALEIMRGSANLDRPFELGSEMPVPDSVGALLRRRIDALSAPAAEVLVLAAASPHLTARLLETLSESTDALREAIDAGILERDGERLRFTHPLFGSVAYAAAPPAVRREIHRRLAAVTEGSERALHLARATEHPDDDVAAELDEAAAQAHRRGAPAAAAELEAHACRLTPAHSEDERLVRTARSAEYHMAAGDTARGRALLEQVVAAWRPGPQRAPLLLRLGHVRYVSDDVRAAHELFQQALAETGDDLRLRAATEQALAFTAMYGGDIQAALAHARASLELAERLDDPGVLALAVSRVEVNEFLAGNGLHHERWEHALSLEDRVEDVPLEWLPSYGYAGVSVMADELERARQLYDRLYDPAVERADERAIPTLLFAMAELECAAGNWSLASRHAAEAVKRSRQSGLRSLHAYTLHAQALVDAHVGRVEGARAAAAEGLQIAHEVGAVAPLTLITSTLGFLELSLGDAAAAHGHLAPLSELVAAIGVGEPGVVRFLPDEIEALILLGELEAATPLLRLLEKRGRALDRVSALAAAARCRALLHAARGDFDAATASLGAAHVQHERLDRPFELGRTLLVQGSVERRAKRRAAARESLTSALVLFDSLGASLWAEKTAAELARIPGRARSSGELGETERRIAELAAEGRSNREIAAQLFVTVRTVESNLSKVYAKLGIRSRAALASRLGRQTRA